MDARVSMMGENQMQMADTEDRVLIRDVYGRYAVASARRDVDAWIACWAERGLWITQHFSKAGRAEIREQWDVIWTMFSNVAAFNEVGSIEISGNSAKVQSSVLEFIQLASGGSIRMAGLYDDELIREGGAWRFARREYRLLSQSENT